PCAPGSSQRRARQQELVVALVDDGKPRHQALTPGRRHLGISRLSPRAAFSTLNSKRRRDASLIPSAMHSIGYSLGALLGALLAAPSRRHVLFIGEGSFQLTSRKSSGSWNRLWTNTMRPSISFELATPLQTRITVHAGPNPRRTRNCRYGRIDPVSA